MKKKDKLYLQVFDLQGVHVQLQDVAGRSEAVLGLNHVTELGLGEELLLCQGPAEATGCSPQRGK